MAEAQSQAQRPPRPEPPRVARKAASGIHAAVVKAVAEMPALGKDQTARIPTKDGGSFSYAYAGLSAILAAVRPVLASHGLALVQGAEEAGNGLVAIRTVLVHESGETMEFGPLVLPAGNTPQTYGSAVTYGRRYSICAVLGLAPDEDDDGEAASATTSRSVAGSDGDGPVGKADTGPSTPAVRRHLHKFTVPAESRGGRPGFLLCEVEGCGTARKVDEVPGSEGGYEG